MCSCHKVLTCDQTCSTKIENLPWLCFPVAKSCNPGPGVCLGVSAIHNSGRDHVGDTTVRRQFNWNAIYQNAITNLHKPFLFLRKPFWTLLLLAVWTNAAGVGTCSRIGDLVELFWTFLSQQTFGKDLSNPHWLDITFLLAAWFPDFIWNKI